MATIDHETFVVDFLTREFNVSGAYAAKKGNPNRIWHEQSLSRAIALDFVVQNVLAAYPGIQIVSQDEFEREFQAHQSMRELVYVIDASGWVVLGPVIQNRDLVEQILEFYQEKTGKMSFVQASKYIPNEGSHYCLPEEAWECSRETGSFDDDCHLSSVLYISCNHADHGWDWQVGWKEYFVGQQGHEDMVVKELVELLLQLNRESRKITGMSFTKSSRVAYWHSCIIIRRFLHLLDGRIHHFLGEWFLIALP